MTQPPPRDDRAGPDTELVRLRDSEALLRQTLDAISQQVWVCDARGQTKFTNRQWLDYVGWSGEPPCGTEWVELLHPDDRDATLARWAHSIATGEPFEMEIRLRGADGAYRWFLGRAGPIRDRAGTILRWVGSNTDIDDGKRATAALTVERARLQAVLDAVPVGIVIAEAPSGRIVRGNPQTERIARHHVLRSPSIEAYTDWPVFRPDGRPLAAEEYPLSRVLVTGEPTSGEEYLYRRGDGTQTWVRLIAAPVRGAAGETIAGVVAIVDIDREKRIERALRESEKIFRDLTEALPQIVWTATVDGGLDYCNRRWPNFTGTSSDEANGEGWIHHLHPDDAPRTRERWYRCVETGEPFETEYRLRDKEGDHHWFLARAVPLRDEAGRILRWFGTCTDIGEIVAARQTLARGSESLAREVAERTRQLEEANARLRTEMEERSRAEEALRHAHKMEAIGQLTGGIAHDFNNLLQVVAGNLQLLNGDLAGNAIAAQRIRNALSGVERGAKLASQLLAFARRQPLAPQVVNLGRLVRSMRDLLRRSLGEEIETETAVAEGLWNTLIDPVQVENAILNLAVNARDAMAGGGRLTIEVANTCLDAAHTARHPEAKPGQYVMLAVSDTGSGMPQDVLARAFEPFFTTKPEGHGTGLGLPMVYGFVRQSDGWVELDSEPGRGTMVRIFLPREHREEKAAPERPAGPVSGGSETILVVEDDAEVRATVVDILRDLGYRVLQAEDGASALAIVRSGVPIDLLFTDVIMPGAISSPELAGEARRVLPDLAVLFTSGYARDAIVHGGRLDEGIHLLSKPFRNEELAHRLRQLLDDGNEDAPVHETERDTEGRSGPRPRVLLVEDELLIRDWIAEMLRDLGHEVEEADSAEEALARLERGGIGVLVTDIGLPGRSGEELAADAARLDPSLRVVLATGRGRTDLDAEKLGCAALEYLGKPYEATDVERAMANVLGGQRSGR